MTQTKGAPGYERRDARMRPMLLAIAALLALTAGGLAVGRLLLPASPPSEGPVSPMAPFRARPAGPQLETYSGQELGPLRAWEAERLSTYGWIDRTEGTVHIPLDRAMRLTLEELGGR